MHTPGAPIELSRREFLGGTLAGAAALLGGPLAAGAAAPRPRNFRKAVKIGMVQVPGPLKDRFALLRELGFDGVELDSPNDLDPDEVLRARDDTGLSIPGVVDSVHWRDTLSDADPAVRARGRAALETALRDCKTYGGSSVLLVPAVVGKGVSYDAAWKRSLEEVRAVLPLAAELEVSILFENVWNHFLLSPLEAAAYVDAFESPWVGFHFDVGNVVLYGWPEHWVEILGPRIQKLDVKEFSRRKAREEGLSKGFSVELLEGDCDWPAVMRALDEVGYFEREGGGWGAAEVQGGDRERLAFLAERMDRVFAS